MFKTFQIKSNISKIIIFVESLAEGVCPLALIGYPIYNSTGYCLSCAFSDFRSLDSALGRCLPMLGYYENHALVCLTCPRLLGLRIGSLLSYFLETMDKMPNVSCIKKHPDAL
jgi:hypothetical protein